MDATNLERWIFTLGPVSVLALAACNPDGDATDAFGTGWTTASASGTGASGTDSGSAGTSTTGDGTDDSGGSGSSGDTSPPGSTGASGGDGPKFDIAQEADVGVGECLECTLTIASQQSGVFDITGGGIFATATLMNEIVYALGESGNGRFIATADSSLPFAEVTDCPLHTWLAGTEDPDPAVLSVGWTAFDGPRTWNLANETTAGVHLPAQYVGNPDQLAADFDIVMYLEASGQWDQGDAPSDAEMQTLLDYVQQHGGGLYIVSEYADPGINAYLQLPDLDSVNRLLVPLGAEALQVSLDWGNVDGMIDFQCFPPPVG